MTMAEDTEIIEDDDDVEQSVEEKANAIQSIVAKSLAKELHLHPDEEEDEDDDESYSLDYGAGPSKAAFKPCLSSSLKPVAWKNDDGSYQHSLTVGDQFWMEATHLPWRDSDMYIVKFFSENGAVYAWSPARKQYSVFSLTEGLDAGYRYYEGKAIKGAAPRQKRGRNRRRRSIKI